MWRPTTDAGRPMSAGSRRLPGTVDRVGIVYHWAMSTTLIEPARQVRDHFSEVIERDEPTIITRHGRQIAAVVPIEDWRRFEELENLELCRLVEERRHELAGPLHSFADVLQETMERRA